MLVKNRLFNVFVSLLLVMNLALANVSVAFAEDGSPPEPTPTVVPTEDPITPPATETATPEPEVTETPTPGETATPLPEETVPPAEEAEPVGLLSQLPENTEIVVLDQNGESVPLTSEAALNTILDTDPMWCPAEVLPGPGCTMNFPDIGSLIADMITNTPTYDENGIIYFTVTPGASFSLTTASLGIPNFNTLNDFNLTLQGGWNGLNGAAATFTGQTNFAANTITIGTLANPWVGNITLNNFTFNGVSSTSAVTVYTTTGNITLDNVDVAQQTGSTNTALLNTTSGNITVQNGSTFDGNNSAPPTNGQSSGFFATTGTGSINISDTTFQESRQTGNNTFDGATLSAPIVTLNSVTSQNNDGDGITINNANVVTLNNVTATGNGTETGGAGLTGNDGSGVLVNGNPGSKVIIIGGTFTNNQEYGVEVGSAANTTVYVQSNPTCTGNDSNSPLPTGAGSCYNTSSILDTTPPVITPAITGTAGANSWYTSDVNVNWSVTDTQSGIASSTGCSISSQTTETTGVTLTCSATNNAGLSASNSVTIKIDKSNPTATLAVIAGTLGSNGWYTSDVTLQTSGTDSISGPVTCTANQSQTTETTGTTFNGACTNNAGLTTNATALTIKLDKTGPTATLVVIAGTSGSNGWYTSDVTVQTSGAESISGPASCTPDQFQTTETTEATFNGSCVNNAGLTTNATSITIKLDKTIPVIAFVNRTPANANGWNNTDVTVNWSCTDSLSGAVSASINQTVSTEAANQSTTGTCQDLAGNTNSNIQSGISIDKTNPTLSLPSSMAVEATSPSGALVSYSASAGDNLDSTPIFGCVPTSGSAFAMGTTTVNCTATDQAGNIALGSFNVSVQDTAGPVIAPHLDVTAEATSSSGATVAYTSPATSDAIDGAGTATCTPVSGTALALGDTTVTCNATDANGNSAIPTTFVVHVVDTTAPVVAAPADVTAEATAASGAIVTYTSPTTSDAVDGAGTATCSPASGSVFALGDTPIPCNATDANGNSAIPSTFVVHIVDTTAPIIAAHTDVTVEATSSSGATVTYTNPAISDVVDGAGIALCSPASGNTFPLGNTTITCNATDANGNSAIPAIFVVHVVDTTAPIISVHTDVTAEATSASGAIVTYTSPATSDIADGAGTATCSPASGTVFALGNTTVTCNATDANSNSALPTTFVVQVVDTTAPVIAAHADVIVGATSGSGATAAYTSPATSDAVDGVGTATCSPASGSVFALGDTTVTCNATDANGNSAIPTTFVVHVVDANAPMIAPHLDVTVEAASGSGATAAYTSPATSDTVDGAGTATCSPASGTVFALGNTTVTCNATDSNGNSAIPSTFVVHVVDTTAPIITAHTDVTAEATSSSGATVTYINPTTSDLVDSAGTATCSPASGTVVALGDTTVVCNATDTNGNSAVSTTFVVHVVDTTAPVIAAHANVTVVTNNNLGMVVAYSSPTTSDVVDGLGTASCVPTSGSFFPVGNTLVSCNATDANGNIAQSTTFTVTVTYNSLPQSKPQSTAPQPQKGSNGFNIPVTGGNTFELDCLSIAYAFGIKITFHNLCDYQAMITSIDADTLPSQLPNGFSFVKALNVAVLFDGILVKALPIGTGLQLDFRIPANSQEQYTVLLWDSEANNAKGEWLDVTQLVQDKDLTKVMFNEKDDELYHIAPIETLKAFYRIITADKSGTFVLVKK